MITLIAVTQKWLFLSENEKENIYVLLDTPSIKLYVNKKTYEGYYIYSIIIKQLPISILLFWKGKTQINTSYLPTE